VAARRLSEGDTSGNFAGTIPEQGHGDQPGAAGSLQNFSAVFTGSLNLPAAGPATFAFTANDAFIFSVANGATPVSGPQTNTPPNSAFPSYPVMGEVNQRSAPATSSIRLNFPAAGVYPYEVDCAKGTPNTTPSTTAGQGLAWVIQAPVIELVFLCKHSVQNRCAVHRNPSLAASTKR
jgi:hypothetical protein